MNKTLHDELQGILASDEYQIYYQQKRNLLGELWSKLQDFLSRFLQRFINDAPIASKASEWLAYGIIVLFLVLLILVFYFFLSKWVRRKSLRGKALQSEQDLALSFNWHFHEADKYIEDKQYALALRHLFIGFILLLDKQEFLKAKIWKTNGEYLEELKKHNQDLARDFHSMALKYEEVVYGGRSISQDELNHLRHLPAVWRQKGEENVH